MLNRKIALHTVAVALLTNNPFGAEADLVAFR